MDLHGKNLIAGNPVPPGKLSFTAHNAATAESLAPSFSEASAIEVDSALSHAEAAFPTYSQLPADRIAAFLSAIADQIVALGDVLIQRANLETSLPEARLIGERARTVNQLKMFADLVCEGSWLDACIDRAQPERKPLPKPDVRRMLMPIGPVVVFGASNFPLAFSVAGGDTASALAAGNPVIVKGHPAHPGTSELVARALLAAAEHSGMPAGVFSLLQGTTHELSLALVRHPATRAVGFTGSLTAGRALFDAAAARPEPIPVYAEMGSTNPVFILPGALKKNGPAIAEGFIQSVTLGVGQFCTNPGLVFSLASNEMDGFIQKTADLVANCKPGTMLYRSISERFNSGLQSVGATPGVRVIGQSTVKPGPGQASVVLFAADAKAFLTHETLREELFGPASLIVTSSSTKELEQIAQNLPGQLTATLYGTDEDLLQYRALVSILQRKVGRIIFNNFPTGVEVCPAMHHGGPYPATTSPHFTSVGTAAIRRFVRPLCFQNFPDAALPPELQNQNPRNLWRWVEGKWTKEACS